MKDAGQEIPEALQQLAYSSPSGGGGRGGGRWGGSGRGSGRSGGGRGGGRGRW